MRTSTWRSRWLPYCGWFSLAFLFFLFFWGLNRRAQVDAGSQDTIQMLFVPSVEQGTLVRRGDELARFIRRDSGLTLRSQVPTSYAAVIQALGAGQADVAWIPAFGYVLANARYGAEARLQVVRSVERHGAIFVRRGASEPVSTQDLARGAVAMPDLLEAELREQIIAELDDKAPGWAAVPAASDNEAVRMLVEREVHGQREVLAAASRHVVSGPHDLVGDGTKELEATRPGTVRETRLLFTTSRPVHVDATVYYGCVMSRSDSGIHRLEDLSGKSFAFSDETSTSGHVFARALLQRVGVNLGHVLFAGGHPNVVQAVYDGKVAGGAAFYSPPSEIHQRDGLLVGDARHLILKRMQTVEERQDYLSQVRILALTNPIPNDVCCVRKGFSESLWQRFEESLQRFLLTEEGQKAYDDLVAGVAAARCSDADFQGFREALQETGVSAAKLLEEAERKLEARRK